MATLAGGRKAIKISNKGRTFRNSNNVQLAKNKEKFKKFMMQLFELSALTLFATALYHLSLSHPMFNVKTIQAEGLARLSQSDVTGMLGYIKGKNIFLNDTDKAEMVLENNPWIESAVVSRIFPSTLNISVTERTPVLVVVKNDKLYLSDISGFLIEEIASASGYLKVIGINEKVKAGRRLNHVEGFSKALKIREIFELDKLFRDSIASVDISSRDRLVAYTYSGVGVAFDGDLRNLEGKFLEYLAVRKILTERGDKFKLIDLSFEGQAVVKRDAEAAPIFLERGGLNG